MVMGGPGARAEMAEDPGARDAARNCHQGSMFAENVGRKIWRLVQKVIIFIDSFLLKTPIFIPSCKILTPLPAYFMHRFHHLLKCTFKLQNAKNETLTAGMRHVSEGCFRSYPAARGGKEERGLML